MMAGPLITFPCQQLHQGVLSVTVEGSVTGPDIDHTLVLSYIKRNHEQ